MKRIVLLWCLACSFLWAHKINLFITTQKQNVEIYSYFANAAPCSGCALQIKYNEKMIVDGQLNEEGKYEFQSSYPSLDIYVSTVGGHMAHQAVVVEYLTKESLQQHQAKEQSYNYFKVVIALILLVLVFVLIKRVKR